MLHSVIMQVRRGAHKEAQGVWGELTKPSAERVPWSWPKRDRLQGPREAGRGPSWKYRGLLQLEETALPSRGGGTDGELAGSGWAGP